MVDIGWEKRDFKFKIGDAVILKSKNFTATVVARDWYRGSNLYYVNFGRGTDWYFEEQLI